VLSQKFVLSFSSKISIQLLQVVASIVVAIVAGPTILGTVAFALAYASMFEFVTQLGLGGAHNKLVSEGNDLGDCIATYGRLKIYTTIIYIVVSLSFFAIQKYVFGVEFESLEHQYVILVFVLFIAVRSIITIANMTFASRTEQAKQSIPELSRVIFLQILRISIVLLGYGAIQLALGNLLSLILILPVVGILFKKYPIGKYNKELASKYFKIAIPLIVLGVSATAIRTLDKVILQFLSNSEQVGYYAAAYRLCGFILIIGNSVGFLFFPLFSKHIANGNIEYVKNLVLKYEKLLLVFVMPVISIITIYSNVIVELILGTEYSVSAPIISILIVGMFILVLNTPHGNVITGMGLFKTAASIHFINVVLFVSSLFLFVSPDFFNLEAKGVAIAVLISNIFLSLVYRIYSKFKMKKLDINSNIPLYIYGILMTALGLFIFNKYVLYQVNLYIYLFPIVYMIVLYLLMLSLKLIKTKDLVILRGVLSPGKLKGYILSELKEKP
jgi:O-antigen/teichoic acid export membrane protein